MKYIKIETKEYPLTIFEIRAQNPTISFPVNVSEKMLLELGYAIVKESPWPGYNPLTQKIKELVPKLVKGVYYEEYEVVELNESELKEKQELFGVLKSQKIAEFKLKRDKDETAPITTDKGLFDFDEKSLMRLNEAKDILGAISGSLPWMRADNTPTNISYEDIMNIKLAAAQRSGQLHVKYNQLKAQVNVCQSIDELFAIDWEGV